MQLTGVAVGFVVGDMVGDKLGEFLSCQHNTHNEWWQNNKLLGKSVSYSLTIGNNYTP